MVMYHATGMEEWNVGNKSKDKIFKLSKIF